MSYELDAVCCAEGEAYNKGESDDEGEHENNANGHDYERVARVAGAA